MKTVHFPQANVNIAENQPEYTTVPAYVGVVSTNPDVVGVICKVQFDFNEMQNILANNNSIWLRMLTFGKPLQPFSIHTQTDIFSDENEFPQHPKEDYDYYDKYEEFEVKLGFWDRVKFLFGYRLSGLVKVEAWGNLHSFGVKQYGAYTTKKIKIIG